MKLLKLPIITYAKRYWPLLLELAVLIYAYTSGTIGVAMKGILLIPIFTLSAAASGLLLRNVYNRSTTDKYVDDKVQLTKDWESLTSYERIKLMKFEALTYFMGGSIIAAGLVIIINV